MNLIKKVKNEKILQMKRCLSEMGWRGYIWKYFCTDAPKALFEIFYAI